MWSENFLIVFAYARIARVLLAFLLYVYGVGMDVDWNRAGTTSAKTVCSRGHHYPSKAAAA